MQCYKGGIEQDIVVSTCRRGREDVLEEDLTARVFSIGEIKNAHGLVRAEAESATVSFVINQTRSYATLAAH